jgi:uncharacterized protein YndB with AHSA1/START domain
MTTSTDDSTVVHTRIEVPVPPSRAFDTFTSEMNTWWTRSHHVQSGELTYIGADAHVGGRMWEENDAGDVCVWGRVLRWEPPAVFAFSWLIGPDWGIPAADATGSRVTVTFTATATGTLVELVHDQLDAHGTGWQNVRNGVASDGGWPAGLRQLADAV